MTARRNQVIELISQDKPAFGGTFHVGDLFAARKYGDSDLDWAMVDMEHEGADLPALGDTLQWMISRRRAAKTGNPFAGPTPIVRLPYSAHDASEWIANQALDYGALGLILMNVEEPEQVEAMVHAMRYPLATEGGMTGGGRRVWPKAALRYWGYDDYEEYMEAADLWPLNPNGELLLIATIATPKGFENIDRIAAVPGLSSMLFGAKHTWASFGHRGRVSLDNPELSALRTKLLTAAKNNGLAPAVSASSVPPGAIVHGTVETDFIGRQVDAGFRIFFTQGTSRPQLGA